MYYTEEEHRYAIRKAKKIRGIRLLGGRCSICSMSNIHLLEFHHDDKNKESSISQILDYRWSNLEKEIKKCKLLCANCHAEYHCNSKGGGISVKNKNKILKLLNISKCSKCGYSGSNFASLDFHHENQETKGFGIADGIKGVKGIKDIPLTFKDILYESKKCLVICKNCHKKQHFDIKSFNKLLPLIKYKIQNLKEKPPEYNKNKIWKLYKNGKKLSDICRIIGCKSGTLTCIIQQLRTKNGMDFKDHRSGRKWKKKIKNF
jgi:hypothetical protein